ncbi:MAG: hypothetical protein KIT09_35230 [Bryobacteraceae bacterium]|nr:hypothetical protein [Bryobacteraceae bacterium]
MAGPTAGRRVFLQGLAGGGLAAGARAAQKKDLPAVRIGGKQVSRLIAGGNTMRGFSHSSAKLSRHMVEYFTPQRISEFLLRCEAEGITTFQSSYSKSVREGILGARERGSKVQFICLTSPRHGAMNEILELKPIAIVHHGSVTDPAFRAGQPEKVHDYIKQVHDAGVMAGVSTHNPDYLARMEDAGWETDLYMACMYNMTRTDEELRKMLGGEVVLGEAFVASDPPRMVQRIRQISKPCLAFKILAAGRLSESKESLARCFQYAYSSIKPGDAAIVGMYPVFEDEIAEDADLTRKYGLPT